MGALTGRFTRYDITSVTVSGVDITSLLTDASLEVTVDEIDANALQDEWNQREYGRGDWSLAVTKYATDALLFPQMALSRDLISVTVNITGGITLTGNAMAQGGSVSLADMVTEECTFVSGGGSPTIS